MKIVNAIGKKCPLPLIETKKALNESAKDESIQILTDSETSFHNVCRFLDDHQLEYIHSKNKDVFEIMIHPQDRAEIESRAEEYCSVPSPNDGKFTLVLAKNTIGKGPEELGLMLVQGFLNTFLETDNLPDKIIFLNSGIELVTEESAVIGILNKMTEKGVEVLVCGTCLEYYKRVNDLKLGTISNAYEILEVITNAPKIVNI